MQKNDDVAPLPDLFDRLAALISRIEAGLLERETATRLCLLAALAGEHVLLIGPPGTAKSELARRLHSAFVGARYFERLLTRFSTPEELFGPLSLTALENDRYERLVDGYLPTAGIAFLDEVFKANSAILNALLTLLNEREFDNGSARLAVPLISVVGASNEVPSDDSLMAFYDRFLLRVPVQPVSDQAFTALLQMDRALRQSREHNMSAAAAAPAAEPLTAAECGWLQSRCQTLLLAPATLEHLHALRSLCGERGIVVSDRRWRQLVGLLKMAACSEGRDSVDPADLWLATYAVASQPSEIAGLNDWFLADVVQAAPFDAPWLARAVEAFERQLEIEQMAGNDQTDAAAGKLAIARAIGGSDAEAETGMLRIARESLDKQLHRRYSQPHVAARVAQVEQVQDRADAALSSGRAHAEQTKAALQHRLWMPPGLVRQISDGVQHTVDQLDRLARRLDITRTGFAALPIDGDAADAPRPKPVAIDGEA